MYVCVSHSNISSTTDSTAVSHTEGDCPSPVPSPQLLQQMVRYCTKLSSLNTSHSVRAGQDALLSSRTAYREKRVTVTVRKGDRKETVAMTVG